MIKFIEVIVAGQAILLNCNLISYIAVDSGHTIIHLAPNNPFNKETLQVEKAYNVLRAEILD